MAARNYSSVARSTTLTGSISGSATGGAVTETTGFPSVPFTVVIDPGRSEEEAVTVTAQVGLNLTLLRGQDGTSAQPHDAGATVRHMATARDFREPADHIVLEANVHGVESNLVGEADTQTLDNKTFQAGVTDHTAVAFKAASGQTAPIVVFSDAAGATLGSVGVTGRVSTPGVDGTSSTTLTAGSAATVPLIVKGAASQTAKLLSARDSSDTEMASVDAAGLVTAATVTASTVNSTTIANATSAVFSTATDVVPLTAKTAAASTAHAFDVKDSGGTARSGVLGDSDGYQLFQGSATNKVPFRVHGGTDSVVMTTGSTSFSGTVNYASLGFTVAPLVMLTVRQDNNSTLKRRVAVNMEGPATTTGFTYRVIQTSAEAQPTDELYIVHWVAFQITPSAAGG